jgi:hypothetical protein
MQEDWPDSNSLERTPPLQEIAFEARSLKSGLLRCKIIAGPLPGLVRQDRQLAAVMSTLVLVRPGGS